MAVTTTIESYAQYADKPSSNLNGCLNGGEDFRTLDANKKNIYGAILAIRGWCGDNISNACQITKIQITGDVRTRSTSNGSTNLKGDCDFTVMIMVRDSSESGGISGDTISNGLQTLTCGTFEKTANSSRSGFNYTPNISGDARANSLFPAVKMDFWSGNAVFSVRYDIKN